MANKTSEQIAAEQAVQEQVQAVQEQVQAVQEQVQAVQEQVQAEETVKIKIPVDKLNPGDKEVPVGINGRFWKIKRGEEVEVPLGVKLLLEQADYI